MMSIGKELKRWLGNHTDTSHLGAGGVTGLGLVTDDESVMMEDYIKLPKLVREHSGFNVDLNNAIIEALNNEVEDYHHYHNMASAARKGGMPDIGLILDIIANEEHNHHEILEALLPDHEKYESTQTEILEHHGLAAETEMGWLPDEILRQQAARGYGMVKPSEMGHGNTGEPRP
jgi:hypothetical protein